MSDPNREVSEKEIDDKLEEIFDGDERVRIVHTMKFLALILFNIRKDFQELYKDYTEFKERVLDVLKPNEKSIEKKIDNNDIERLFL